MLEIRPKAVPNAPVMKAGAFFCRVPTISSLSVLMPWVFSFSSTDSNIITKLSLYWPAVDTTDWMARLMNSRSMDIIIRTIIRVMIMANGLGIFRRMIWKSRIGEINNEMKMARTKGISIERAYNRAVPIATIAIISREETISQFCSFSKVFMFYISVVFEILGELFSSCENPLKVKGVK